MSINANDLTFGIEIECNVNAAKFHAAGWMVGQYHRGAMVPGFPGWNIQRDGSVQVRRGDAMGIEVVSGVLQGAAGLVEVKRMLDTLRTMGATVNASCGLHVHVGWSGSDAALYNLLAIVSQNELGLLASTGTRTRDHNRYCNSTKATLSFLRDQKTLPTRRAAGFTGRTLADISNDGARYQVLNVTRLLTSPSARTVEFRVFAGTTNYRKIATYIQIALGLVVLAQSVKRTPAWDAKATTVDTGASAMKRLTQRLGWLPGAVTRHGRVGWLENDRALGLSLAELKRLAARYTATATPRPSAAEAHARAALAAAQRVTDATPADVTVVDPTRRDGGR